MDTNAANSLLNTTLKSGWKVIRKLEKGDGDTGSFFSVCYHVEKDGEICFMKAYDFAKFFQISDCTKSVIDVIGDMTNAYRYERDLSNHCKAKKVTKVAFVKEAGEELIPGYTVSIVPYLIFDMAEGDVRRTLRFAKNLDYAWRLKSLHDVCVGLKQLHNIEVSHQDLKPSNVLVYIGNCKIGDIGRSMCRAIDGPYNRLNFSGDFTYAPPEIMYGYHEVDWFKRVFATDCYLMGSMIVFYFTGVSMSAMLKTHLSPRFWIEYWKGSFEELKPYLVNAFSRAISEFKRNIDNESLKADLSNCIYYLCHPVPEERGHPKTIGERGSNQFNFERIVTMLDRLRRRAELQTKTFLN